MARDLPGDQRFGGGCLLLAGGIVLLAGLAALWVWRRAEWIERDLRDEPARSARAAAWLGVAALPEGWHAAAASSIPFVFDIAIVTDRAPQASGLLPDLGSHGLIWARFAQADGADPELRGYLAGNAAAPRILSANGIEILAREPLGHGVLTIGGATVAYRAQRGSVVAEGFRGGGIVAAGIVDCPRDPTLRVAIWFAPDTYPPPSAPAIEHALSAFLGRFQLCA